MKQVAIHQCMSKLNHLASVEKYSLLRNASEIGDKVLKVCQSIQRSLIMIKLVLCKITSESTHLLCNGKYHYHYQVSADLLFNWFAFSSFLMFKFSTDLLAWLNPSRRSTVQ